ncbi:hypothetical protein C8R44DRAFT_872081 [Mycena epipterygia]|nr:hypothetical protein C8R44DRAFT_872081 [Mycena epipterygia]
MLKHLRRPNSLCRCLRIKRSLNNEQRLPRPVHYSATEQAQAQDISAAEDEDMVDWVDKDMVDLAEDIVDSVYEDMADWVDEEDISMDVHGPSSEDVPKSCLEEFPNAAWLVEENGQSYMQKFYSDEHADKCADNLYYPFATSDEWQLASFLNRSSLSVAETDEFLRSQMVKKMGLSFRTTKDLRSRIEMLPKGPQWQAEPWPSLGGFPVKEPLTLFYRDALECLESLLQNPLVQDHIDYTPFKLFTTAEQTMRVYTEWLSGNTAWGMQEKIPTGGTIIGVIGTSDKTQITSMTGNRVAHPFLLSIANIQMEYRMKASHQIFLLTAMVPVAKFNVKNKEHRGVLNNRLYHACVDFVLRPVKEAAKIGVMMTDAFGRRRWCFTPLASHIVDTPEALMVAGVAANQSPLTTASSKHFGNPSRHRVRTRERTFRLIRKAEAFANPWALTKYVKCAKKLGLNGVHRPYWRDWPMSEPSTFLTPEILHHWLKMFWDHMVKWCLHAASPAELDFRFSVLRPHTGMRHFREGISKAKQVTGREHRDILRYIVPVIAGAKGIDTKFLTAIRSVVDFIYRGQAPKIDEKALDKMDGALKTFHAKKSAILKAKARRGKRGPINDWRIPKLEFLQSVVSSIRANGVPLQWSADVTERAHIPLIKEPASRSNNQKHEQQICRYLDRRDKVDRFDLATAMAKAGVELGVSNSERDESDADDSDEEGPVLVGTTSELLQNIEPTTRFNGSNRALVNHFTHSARLSSDNFPHTLRPFRTFTSSQGNTSFHLGRDHVGPQQTVEDASIMFKLPDLGPALCRYLHRVSLSENLTLVGRRPALKDGTLPPMKLKIWHKVRMQSFAFHNPDRVLDPETVHASPFDSDWKFGRGDAVLVNSDTNYKWPRSGLKGHTVGQLRMILCIAPNQNLPASATAEFLAYVERFDIVGPGTDLASGMHRLKRAKKPDGTIIGDFIPLDRLRARVELTPRFGKTANRRLTKENSLNAWDNFWLTKYFNKDFFFALDQ